MIEEIVSKTMRNGIVRFAEAAGVPPTQSQLMIFTKSGEVMPSYKSVLYSKGAVREVSFNEILGVKVDLLNREAIAAPFIAKSMARYADELGVPPTKIFIMVLVVNDKQDIRLALYKGKEYQRPLQLSEVLGQPAV